MIRTKNDAGYRPALLEIMYAIDAINAAVKGADFNDSSQQRGISCLLGEQYCHLSEPIDKIAGGEEAKGHAE